jgi:hypothetical protein
MATIQLHQTRTVTPHQFVAGLTDYGPGRPERFGQSADDCLGVHVQIVLTTTDSNAWARSSGHMHNVRPRAAGTDVAVVEACQGKDVKRRLLDAIEARNYHAPQAVDAMDHQP